MLLILIRRPRLIHLKILRKSEKKKAWITFGHALVIILTIWTRILKKRNIHIPLTTFLDKSNTARILSMKRW